MPYTAPTAADLTDRHPEFATVDVTLIDAALTDAGRMVDATWTEEDYQPATMYLAAHILAEQGYGTGPDSLANQGQLANFQTIRSGQLTLTRTGARAVGVAHEYSGTRYGNAFWRLLRLNKGGPRVVVADAPVAPWPWVYP